MSVREWDALAWWERRLYLDGWTEEQRQQTEAAEAPSASAPEVPAESIVFSGTPGEMAAVGFTEQTLPTGG